MKGPANLRPRPLPGCAERRSLSRGAGMASSNPPRNLQAYAGRPRFRRSRLSVRLTAPVLILISLSAAAAEKSVRRQVNAAKPVEGSFFTVPWPDPLPGTLVPISPALSASETPAGSVATAAAEDCAPIPPSQLDDYIEQVAEREGYTPDLLRAVINRESAFQPCAVSRKGAQGLMQLMPQTAAALGVRNLFDPKQNIDAGARYLGKLLARYSGDLALALGAYNAGPSRVDFYEGLPPIPETIDYVADIMKALRVKPLPSPQGVSAGLRSP